MPEETKAFFSHDTADAIDRLAHEIKTGIEWLKSQSHLVKKEDLAETEKRILDAIKAGGGSPEIAKALSDITEKLKGPSGALDAAVKAAPTA